MFKVTAQVERLIDLLVREGLLPDNVVDLSQVNLRVIPKTTALLEQKIYSFTPMQAWWFDTLNHGELPRGIADPESNTCLKDHLFNRYIRHANRQGVRRKAIETEVGMFLRKYVPGLVSAKTLNNRKQRSIYRFPSLKDCRDCFAKLLQQEIKWGNDNDEWDHEEDATADLPF